MHQASIRTIEFTRMPSIRVLLSILQGLLPQTLPAVDIIELASVRRPQQSPQERGKIHLNQEEKGCLKQEEKHFPHALFFYHLVLTKVNIVKVPEDEGEMFSHPSS